MLGINPATLRSWVQTAEADAGSIATVGEALANTLMESTIGLYKAELIHQIAGSWRGRQYVEVETAEYVRWFNQERRHSSIRHVRPATFEQTRCSIGGNDDQLVASVA